MEKSKLITVLTTLTKEEWGKFRKHVKMYTFEKSEIYYLFSVLQAKKNEYEYLGTIEEFQIKYFPQLSIKALSNLMAKLYQIIEAWLAVNEMQSTSYDEEIYLLKSLNRRGLFNQANYIARKIEADINTDSTIDIAKAKCLVELYYSQYYSNNPQGKSQLGNLIKWHTTAYLESSVFYDLELVNWGNIARINFEYEMDLIKKSTKNLDKTKLSSLINSIKLIFLKDDKSAFDNIVSSLLSKQFSFGTEFHLIITNYMEILSRKLFMKGILKDGKMVTKIQTYSLEVSANTNDGRISPQRFQNMIAVLSYMNTYDWTKKFIDKWIKKVASKNLDANLDLAYAQNCFYHNKFGAILNFTSHTTYDDINQKARALALQLIGLYYLRTENYENYSDAYVNLKNLLKRNKNKLSISAYQGFLNLISNINNLNRGKYDKVQISLNSNLNIIYRSWVEKQVIDKKL